MNYYANKVFYRIDGSENKNIADLGVLIDSPKYLTMKTVMLLLAVVFTSMAITGCTNDEGDEDIDVITPNDEEELLIEQQSYRAREN
ncbi:MAG: hypothetical protein ED555_07485 [Allomuricauda sp.]|nr:MAG: hypothetical protein ED555_07485 [Allomuricauda sp.]